MDVQHPTKRHCQLAGHIHLLPQKVAPHTLTGHNSTLLELFVAQIHQSQ